ncbi:MAG: prepilin peptidase [Methanoregulaceae archaeon]|nr:prepilin peptidase [Methanoregulaceae archaeon]
MFPEWTWLVGLMLGATIGSFLNVVIYRMPRGMSLSEPRHSICPKCRHRLSGADLIPLFSWLMLAGKCRYCQVKVPGRYFAVELFTGVVWAAIWNQYFINDADWPRAIAYMAASAALVAIIWIDWELYLIPDQINAFLAFVGIAYNIYLYSVNSPFKETWGMPSALAGWLVGVAVLWGIAFLGRLLFGKDAMGHGDIKMARGIGAVLFPAVALISFGLAVVLGAVLGIAQVLWLRTRATSAEVEEEDEEPYVPESLGSLLKCGFGYLIGIDIIGLFYVPLYEKWYGENPYAVPDDLETFEAGNTMIPFGPYLALGAIVATMFSQQLVQGVDNYLNWATGRRVEIHREKSAGTLSPGPRSSDVGLMSCGVTTELCV